MSAPDSPAITDVLQTLRARIRRYVLLEGIAAVVAVVGLIFWVTLAADVAWFKVSRLELPLWFRWTALVVGAGLLMMVFTVWIVLRLTRSYRLKALALVLERRYPQLNDRLVTAVEFGETRRPGRTELESAMLARTIDEANREARTLDLASVFDSRPLRRAVILAVVMIVSISGLGIANASTMRRWYDAWLGGAENYWDAYRKSVMSVQVLAQPGDRIRDFDAQSTYKHPRGADLVLVATVAEEKQVPDDVTLRYRSYGPSGNSSGSSSMLRTGNRQFRHTLARVIDDHELWIVGGDFTNRVPYRIQIVDPPKVTRIVFDCDFPDYTGIPDDSRVVTGSRIALPMETRAVLRAEANKPLRGVQIRSERFTLEVDTQGESRLTLTDVTGSGRRQIDLDAGAVAALLPGDRTTLEFSVYAGADGEQERIRLYETLGESAAGSELVSPFPLLPDEKLQIYLEDTDDILSFDPAIVSISGIPDMPPVVETRMVGIGSRITRKALIPVAGRLMDDHGLAQAWFGYQIGDQEQVQEAPLANPPARLPREFTLEHQPGSAIEPFDVLSLQLQPGTKLSLGVYARDADNINGPHISHGMLTTFDIVSDEDLLGDLYNREVNLRLRFEQIRLETENVRTDLLLHRGRYAEGVAIEQSGAADEKQATELRNIRVAVQASSSRSLHQVRKNHSELLAVEQGFRDLRAELVNNRVDTRAALVRLDSGIITPLYELGSRNYPELDEAVALFGLMMERQQDPSASIDRSVELLDEIIARMDAILQQMQERKDFNQVIQDLQAILDRQRQVLEETERQRQQSVIDNLFD